MIEKLTIDEILDKYTDKITGLLNIPEGVAIEMIQDNDI